MRLGPGPEAHLLGRAKPETARDMFGMVIGRPLFVHASLVILSAQ